MKKKRILIVDDEARFTRLLKLNLEETGRFEVREENGGSEGAVLNAARAFEPDLILLDIVMPEIDSVTLVHKLRADSALREIPIVFVTALTSKGEACARNGMIGKIPLIAKPVSAQDVINCVTKYMRD